MGKISFLSNVDTARKAVESFLTKNHNKVSMTFKHTELDCIGDVVLVIVGTFDGSVFIFDVKTCPAIMHAGQLWRIIEAENLQKVIHDCRASSAVIKQQFGVQLRNVFDTQASFCLLMMQHKLPARLIALVDLYYKYGDPNHRLLTELQEHASVDGGLYWAQRPVSRVMQTQAAVCVRALPAVYDNMTEELSPVAAPFLQELSQAYIDGRFKATKTQVKVQSSSKSLVSKSNPKIALSEKEKHLLSNTVPQPLGSVWK